MSELKITLNSSGIQELLKSDAIMEVCKAQAERIAEQAGDGFAVSPYVGKSRVNVSVYAETWKAYKSALDDNSILKAIR